ncbi:MAG TPA: Arc family DNA-binding protein [Candidatus Poseidoniales archaeon]|nr:MAG TPA: Arc family DNA-binding protein [Candidatus Poseidoniales archaeon]
MRGEIMGESSERKQTKDGMPGGRKKMEKKRILLRIDPTLHDDLRIWAEDDFRSINAQIEFLLKQAVAKKRRNEI